MAHILIVWGMWGPYHCRRLEVLRDYGSQKGHRVTGVSLFDGSTVNQWRARELPTGVVHSSFGNDETRLPVLRLGKLLSLPRSLRADVALLPSYWHWSLVLNAGARLSGARVIMMNDTHAGTARARGLKAWFKKRVVRGFDAGFVAGCPQRRYFASLGLPEQKIFTGYDAVDNEYFAERANEIRKRPHENRARYNLPDHYFLSLGRFVEKKNLATLIRAFRLCLDASPAKQTHLVMVGSGEEEPRLRALCRELNLAVCDHSAPRPPSSALRTPAVHFYGFRQIDENPLFYALADAFILPSLYEEWGLVVNEAMASGLPVLVSETAGCAEDLLPNGSQGSIEPEDFRRIEQFGLASRVRQNGFLFAPRSSEELAHALLLLENSARLRASMGAESRRIVERFSCQNFARNALRAVDAAIGEEARAL